MSAERERDISDYHIEIIMADVADCFVDHRYQRGASKRRVKVLTETWSWRRFLPLIVVQRPDGRFAVVDGQQRLLAAQERGIKQLPAILIRLASPEDEAELFVGADSTSPVGAGDRFRASIFFGDPVALAIKAQVEDEGFTLGCLEPAGPTHLRDPLSIDAVFEVERLFGFGYLSRVLSVLQDTWGEAPVKEMVTTGMLAGLYLALRHLDRYEVSQEALVVSLKRIGVKELLDKGAQRSKSMVSTRSVPGGVAAVIVEHYNYRKHPERTVPPYDRDAALSNSRQLSSLQVPVETRRAQGLKNIQVQRDRGWKSGPFRRQQKPLIED